MFIIYLGLLYLALVGSTWIFQWALTTITDQPMPFWPIFAMLAVLWFLLKGASVKE